MNAFANALLDSRRAAVGGRSEEQPARRGEPVGDAEAQRQLGSDDGEVDLFALGEGENCVRVRDVAGNRSGDPRDAGIPGRADELADVPISGEPGDERMFAAPPPMTRTLIARRTYGVWRAAREEGSDRGLFR